MATDAQLRRGTVASCAVRACRASGVLGAGLALALSDEWMPAMVMGFAGVKVCDENAADNDLTEWSGVHTACIVDAGSVDDHIQ